MVMNTKRMAFAVAIALVAYAQASTEGERDVWDTSGADCVSNNINYCDSDVTPRQRWLASTGSTHVIYWTSDNGTVVEKDGNVNMWMSVAGKEVMTTGVHYWEVEVLEDVKYGNLVGVSRPDLDRSAQISNLQTFPPNCKGWYMDTGSGGLGGCGVWNVHSVGEVRRGDRLGLLLDLNAKTLRFYLNGHIHGPGFSNVTGPLVRTVNIKSPGQKILLDTGATQPPPAVECLGLGLGSGKILIDTGATQPPPAVECPSYDLFLSARGTRAEVQTECQQKGGNLAVIHDRAKNSYIAQWIANVFSRNPDPNNGGHPDISPDEFENTNGYQVYLGATGCCEGKEFCDGWDDGTSMTWHPRTWGGTWWDYQCSKFTDLAMNTRPVAGRWTIIQNATRLLTTDATGKGYLGLCERAPPTPTGNPSPAPTTPAPTENPTPAPTENPTPAPTPGPTSQLDGLVDAISQLSVVVKENNEELSEIKSLLNQHDQALPCYGRRAQP
jgi:hypothetical protein